MIDYIDAVFNLEHSNTIKKGHKINITQAGKESVTNHSLLVKGKYGGSIKVVTYDKNKVRVTGSPAMFLQAQNLYGTNKLVPLCVEVMNQIAKQLKLKPTKENIQSWERGKFEVFCIDVAFNYQLDSYENVDRWLNAVALSVRSGKQVVSAYRAGTSGFISTVYVGQKSNCFSQKFYNKSIQSDNCPADTDELQQILVELSQWLLRVEVRFHKQGLKQQGLTKGSDLTQKVLLELFQERIDGIKFGTVNCLSATDLSSLNTFARLCYEHWLSGGDLKQLLKAPTYATIKKKLMELGVDISQPYLGATHDKPLKYYLQPDKRSRAPKWFKKSKWFFNPE